MGITVQHAQMILKEHKHRPLPKKIHLISRQTVQFDYEWALRIFEEEGISPVGVDVQIDDFTLLAKSKNTKEWISDETFFRMLGVEEIVSIDHSDYEGANLIIDLNEPLDRKHEGVAEFIFGGSVCDNVFDPASYLKNINRLLKSGGRFMSHDVGTNSFGPYVILTPAWFLDYFVINKFSDCKVYAFEIKGFWNCYAYEAGLERKQYPNFIGCAKSDLAIFVVAEKSELSTWNRSPSQAQYRSEKEWDEYIENLKMIKSSERPWSNFLIPVDMPEEMLEYLPPVSIEGYKFLGRFF